MSEVAVGPSLAGATTLDDRDTARERLGAGRAEREVPHSRGLRGSQLERVVLVIIPAAQVDRLAATGGFGHPHDVDEEVEALVGLGCEDFQVREVREVERADCRLHSLKVYFSASGYCFFSSARAALRMLASPRLPS